MTTQRKVLGGRVTPDKCNKCQTVFNRSMALQAELRHIALLEGPEAARHALNERLSDQHEGHR